MRACSTPPVATMITRRRESLVIVVFAALTAFSPMAVDMYLPSLPAVGRDLHAGAAGAQLTLSSFFFGFGVGQLLYGPIADRYGRRRPLIAGIGLFVLASAACATAAHLGWLVLARFLQALGGCAGPVLVRAMVRDLYARDRAAQILSVMVLIMGIAPLLAPLLGSQLLQFFGWRAVFWVLVAFGIACVLATALLLRETLPPEKRTAAGLARAIAAYGEPLTNRAFIGFALAGGFVYAGLFAYLAGSPFVFITLHGVAPGAYGLLFGLNALGMLIAATINARIVVRLTAPRILRHGVAGAALAGLAALLAAAMAPQSLVALVLPLFAFISALGLVGANAMACCLDIFPGRAGLASGLAGTMQFALGGVAAGLVASLHNGTAIPMAGVMALAGLASFGAQRLLAPR